jgi:uncharacterized Tic20 family protein
MPPSADDPSGAERGDNAAAYAPRPGQELAVIAESLYLANLLLLPGIAFVILLVLYWRRARSAPPLALCHLRQTLSASLWAGMLLVMINGLIIALGGYTAAQLWVIVILYFTIGHSTFVMLGILGLARALAGQKFVYPLVGRACPE